MTTLFEPLEPRVYLSASLEPPGLAAGPPGEAANAAPLVVPDSQINGTDLWGYIYDAHQTRPTEPMPIAVPQGDPWFDPFGTGRVRIPFTRASYFAGTGDDPANPRQHPNRISHWMDASMVYGSDPFRAAALRTFDGTGQLKHSPNNLLPINNTFYFPESPIVVDNAGPFPASTLFAAGDVRATENVALASLHTLLLREHNRQAQAIHDADPALSDNEIYQQARHWVAAVVQHITYQEFLPALLGPDPLPAYGGYDPDADPSISAMFSTAAYRLGHSMLFPQIQRLDEYGQSLPGGPLPLHHAFFNPHPVLQDGIDPYLRGMIATPAQNIDTKVIDGVRNFLFGPPGAGGLDLVSINIQRGRDIGLPGYNQARLDMGLSAVDAFDQVTLDPDLADQLQAVYGNVDAIDLWVGGLAEDHRPGAAVGELFAAIIADQFTRLRDADRFWYENGQFLAEDLQAIRETTLATLIERNTGITGLPAHVMTMAPGPAGPAPAGTPGPPGSPGADTAAEYRTFDGSRNNLTHTEMGRAGTSLRLGPTMGYGDGMASPGGQDRPWARTISNALFAQSTDLPSQEGLTGLAVIWGQLLDHDLSLTPPQGHAPTSVPVEGAVVRVSGQEEIWAITDQFGFFRLESVPVGALQVAIDGSQVSAQAGGPYAHVNLRLSSVPGQPLQVHQGGQPFDIYLPAMPSGVMQALSSTEATAVVFQSEAMDKMGQVMPGVDPAVFSRFAVTMAPGSVLDAQGQPVTSAGVMPVAAHHLPLPLPPLTDPAIAVLVHAPEAVRFDVPASITFPNMNGLAPGEKVLFNVLDDQTGSWQTLGTGTVSADGLTVASDPGVGMAARGWVWMDELVEISGVAHRLAHQGRAQFPRALQQKIEQGHEKLERALIQGLSEPAANAYFAVWTAEGELVKRGRTDAQGRWQVAVNPHHDWQIAFWDPETNQTTSRTITSAAAGAQRLPPHLLVRPDHDDPDGDGLGDAAERVIGTLSASADSDGDGLPDGDEIALGLDPLDGRLSGQTRVIDALIAAWLDGQATLRTVTWPEVDRPTQEDGVTGHLALR